MNFKRAVIKVGSALVAPEGQGCSSKYILAIASFISHCHELDIEVILVSSGSVAAGRQLITHGSANASIGVKRAMASVGQMQMMANWQRFFDRPCSQLLITHADLKDRSRYLKVQNTLRILLENKIIPIVNENDTVATQALKIGDNDNLAAMVAMVSDADCLFILSDVEGVFDKDPNKHSDATLIPVIEKIDESIYKLAGGTVNKLATGGMRTKIEAAEKACEHGILTYILNGTRSDVFEQLTNGQNPGTRFKPKHSPARAKKQWLKHTLKSHGNIVVDAGAINAIIKNGASLLAKGILSINGEFDKGESISIINEKNARTIAKGISQYSSHELQQIKKRNSQDILQILGYCSSVEVVHRDDLVLI